MKSILKFIKADTGDKSYSYSFLNSKDTISNKKYQPPVCDTVKTAGKVIIAA